MYSLTAWVVTIIAFVMGLAYAGWLGGFLSAGLVYIIAAMLKPKH